jgi:hypothetical protein
VILVLIFTTTMNHKLIKTAKKHDNTNYHIVILFSVTRTHHKLEEEINTEKKMTMEAKKRKEINSFTVQGTDHILTFIYH